MNSSLNEQLGDGPSLPEMVEANLDDASIGELLADLQAHTTVLGVNGKSQLQQYAEEGSLLTLDAAVTQLRAGQLLAIQVRYLFEKHDWTDTIFKVGASYRLVRCRHSKHS